MIQKLRPYSAMKDSGVPWLGAVPQHWELRRLRNVCEMRVSTVDKHAIQGELPVRLCNYVDVYKNDHIRANMNFMRATATQEEIERFRLAGGDVLITKDSETWKDIGVPAVVREAADDIVSGYHLALLRPSESRITGEFLFRALQTTGVQYQFHIEANGVTRYGLSHSAIKSVWIPVPPLSEQAAIVRFLDHADRRIRRYIRAKQKLIKLLEEQKHAIIHRAVTRGLNPDVRLKPSGVEWLGDVPEHWEARRLRSLARVKTGERDTKDRVDGGAFPFFVRSQTVERIDTWSFDGEAVLTAGDGNGGVGKVFHYVNGKFDYHQRVYKFSHFKEVTGRFFFEYLRATLKFEALAGNSRSTVNLSLRQPMLLNFPCVLPPISEQAAIVEYIGRATFTLDATITRAKREIELLNEYRTRLIADVVTGKLDVREAAAQLPEEVSDADMADEPAADAEADESEELVEAVDEETGA